MFARKVPLVAAFLCGILLLMAGVAPVWAQSETPASPDTEPAAVPAAAPEAAPSAIDEAPSQYISYQGTLRDSSGNPDNGTHAMSVAIYDNAAASGTALFTQSFTGVQVRNGHFSLLFSGVGPAVFSSKDRFLQLTVDGTALTPTQRLAPVPYAVSSNYANSLAAPDGDPLAPISVNNDGNVTVANPYTLNFGSSTRQMVNLYGTMYGIGVQGYTQYFRSDRDFAWYMDGVHSDTRSDPGTGGTVAMLLNDSGNLGIGTASPDRRVTVQAAGTAGEWLSMKDSAGTTQWHANSYNSTGLNIAETGVADGRLFHFYQVTSPAGAATWNQLAASTNCNDIANDCDRVYAISASQNNIFIGGTFTNSNATFAPALTATTSSMAWWNRKANTWSAMDGGVTAPVSGVIPGWMQGVRALVMDRSSLYAGGEFMTAKGSTVPAARISRWSQTIADLALYGTVSPTGTVYVGDQIAYNLTIENLGYATATGTSLYATLPAGVTFVSATSPCTHSAGVVTCNIGNLSLAASTTKTITVRVPTTATGGTVYDFSANVKANQYDPTLVSAFFGNSQIAYSHTAQEKAVLTLAMTGPDTAAGNAVLTYNMTVGNTGPSIAHGASLVDTLPAGAVFTEASSGCTYSSSTGKVTCSLGDMAVGASETRSVSYMTGGCTTGALVNNATATSPQTQTPPTAQKSTTIAAFTGLAINKSDGLTIAGLNEFLTYKIKTWACGASVTNVVMTDPLPASLTWDTTTTTAGTCSQDSGTVTCNVGTLASGGAVDVSIKARTTVEEMLSNTATASGDSVTSVSATDDDTQVGDFADLTLALTAPADATAGVAFNYTVEVTNNGPSAVTDASVAVDLPDGIYYNAATGATCALDTGSLNISANLTCSLGALAVDETKSFTLSATAVQPVQGADVAYTASATVDSAKDHDTAAANTDDADATASAGTLALQTLDGVEVSAYVFETAGGNKRAYGVALDDHFYLAGLNDSVLFAASGATSLAGGGKLNYKKGDVPVYEGDFSSTKTAAWKLTLDPAGEAKVPDVAGFKIKVPENSTLTEVDLPNGKVKGTTDELKLDPPNYEKKVSANFELDSSTTKPNKPSYGGKVNEAFQLDAGIFKLDIPTDAPISDTGINSTSNVDLVMPAYFGSGEVTGSSAGLRHWPGLDDASMTVGGAPGAGFDVPDLKFDTAENFKVKDGTGQLVSAGGKYEAVITSAKLEVDLPANADKEIKKPAEQGGTLDTVYLSPKMKDDGTPETLPDGSIDSDISSSALPEFHLDVAKGDLKVVSAMLKKDGISVSLADYKMPLELGERNKVTPDVKMKPKKDIPQAEMKVNTDETFDVADMDVKDGEKLKVKEAKAKVVQQADGFKLDVTSGKVQVTVLEQNDKLTDLGSATVDKDGKLDGKLANDELTIKVASADLTMKGLSKDHALTSEKGLESDAGKWKLPDELGGQEKDFTPTDKIKIDHRGLKINEDKEVDFPAGNLDDNGHPFEEGKAKLKEAEDRTYKLEIKNKIQIDIPGSQGRKPKENPADPDEKPDAELALDSQKKITGKVKEMELIVSGLTLKDTEWKVEKGQVFSDKAEMKQIEDFGAKRRSSARWLSWTRMPGWYWAKRRVRLRWPACRRMQSKRWQTSTSRCHRSNTSASACSTSRAPSMRPIAMRRTARTAWTTMANRPMRATA